jgi:hypothetical protein
MTVDLSQRASETKRKIGRSVSVNGVHAVEVDVTRAENLQDPFLDLNIKVNNPIGRLWLALKRMWKSQNTVVALRFTIPLIVLPITLYVGYRLWQGRGVSAPMTKLSRTSLPITHSISRPLPLIQQPQRGLGRQFFSSLGSFARGVRQ